MKETDILTCIAGQVTDPLALEDDAYYDSTTCEILTTDMLVEGTHFSRTYCSPEDLGWKVAAVNISDVAAMGGRLKYVLVSLGLPENIEKSFVQAFYQGMRQILDAFDGRVVGGDTVRARDLTLNLVAIGELPKGHTLGRRRNAQVGDLIVTTGYSGLSAVGMQALANQWEGFETCKQRHRRPIPQLKVGLMLSQDYNRYSLMDTSDGLADAALKIALASQVRLAITESCLPVHPELRTYGEQQGVDALKRLILYGGEDFELLATLPGSVHSLPDSLTCIGRVTEGKPGAWLVDESGCSLEAMDPQRTYQHF